MFKIDKDIPAPIKIGGSGNAKYPFSKMEVGDSFDIGSDVKIAKSIRSSAAKYGSYGTNNKVFSTVKVGGRWRVWRIK